MKDLFFWGCLLWLAFALIGKLVPYDDTDNHDQGIRSGMRLYTDYRTGCEYLGSGGIFGGGSLTPRLDGEGRHIGCR